VPIFSSSVVLLKLFIILAWIGIVHSKNDITSVIHQSVLHQKLLLSILIIFKNMHELVLENDFIVINDYLKQKLVLIIISKLFSPIIEFLFYDHELYQSNFFKKHKIICHIV